MSNMLKSETRCFILIIHSGKRHNWEIERERERRNSIKWRLFRILKPCSDDIAAKGLKQACHHITIVEFNSTFLHPKKKKKKKQAFKICQTCYGLLPMHHDMSQSETKSLRN